MSQHPYKKAQRVFLILDNGSAHRGQRSIDRLRGAWPNLVVVHTPIHASWLNQAEIYLSVIQRKVVSPNDFADLETLERHLLAFGRRYVQIAAPFRWKFTRDDLQMLMWDAAGLTRTEDRMRFASHRLAAFSTPQVTDTNSAEDANLLIVSRAVVAMALAREESRGGHYRSDFPEVGEAKAAHSSAVGAKHADS